MHIAENSSLFIPSKAPGLCYAFSSVTCAALPVSRFLDCGQHEGVHRGETDVLFVPSLCFAITKANNIAAFCMKTHDGVAAKVLAFLLKLEQNESSGSK